MTYRKLGWTLYILIELSGYSVMYFSGEYIRSVGPALILSLTHIAAIMALIVCLESHGVKKDNGD